MEGIKMLRRRDSEEKERCQPTQSKVVKLWSEKSKSEKGRFGDLRRHLKKKLRTSLGTMTRVRDSNKCI